MGKLSEKDKDVLEQFIGGGPKTFALLYSITRDGCDAGTFHSKCDNQGPTLTVLYNSHESVYGGYTGVSWVERENETTDSAAFLFRLYLNGKLLPVKFPRKETNREDIVEEADCGPTFGKEDTPDLKTFKGAVSRTGDTFALNGCTNFGESYNMRGVNEKEINNETMEVKELEVYRVMDDDRYPLLSSQWRPTPDWNQQLLQKLLSEIQSPRHLDRHGVDRANVLLVGPVGAGKSSFVNSARSVLLGKYVQTARAGSAQQSLTTVYRQYNMHSADGSLLDFRLCDTRGLEENQGLDAVELNYLLEGNVPDGFEDDVRVLVLGVPHRLQGDPKSEFSTAKSITPTTEKFIDKPSPSDKIHCVVLVLDASTIEYTPDRVMAKIGNFKERLKQNDRGVPFVVLLTKIDQHCRHTEAAIANVFRSSRVKDEVEKAARDFGVPRINILPIKNYENEASLQDDTSILILLALRQMVNFAEEHIKDTMPTQDGPEKRPVGGVKRKFSAFIDSLKTAW